MDNRSRSPAEGKGGNVGGLPSVVVGPVRGDQVLAMARLTRDYSPLHLFVGNLSGKKLATSLHPMWISGGAGAVVEMIARGRRVTELSLKHVGAARVGDTLFVLAATGSTACSDTGILVRVEVSNQNGELVALGEARLVP